MGRAISDNGTHISIALLAREAGLLEHLENLRHGQRATLVLVCLVEGHVQLLELLIQPLIISSRHPGYLKINYTRKKREEPKILGVLSAIIDIVPHHYINYFGYLDCHLNNLPSRVLDLNVETKKTTDIFFR